MQLLDRAVCKWSIPKRHNYPDIKIISRIQVFECVITLSSSRSIISLSEQHMHENVHACPDVCMLACKCVCTHTQILCNLLVILSLKAVIIYHCTANHKFGCMMQQMTNFYLWPPPPYFSFLLLFGSYGNQASPSVSIFPQLFNFFPL